MLQSATVEPTLATVLAELDSVEHELRRRRWAKAPDLWAHERLGDVLWSGQRRIMQAVATHRKTAVATCHEIGKSFSAADIAAWWLDIHKLGDAIVVTTAPTNDQVRLILWKEIGRARLRGDLVGRVVQTEWKARVGDKDETIGIGRKPNDYAPTAFQGFHAPFVLVIVDEANGVRGPLWSSFDSLTANDTGKMLIIGNPDDPTGEFYEACKPNSGFHVMHIEAFESPNFTGEPLPERVKQQLIGPAYVEEKRAKWAPTWEWNAERTRCVMPEGGKLEDTHPFWQSKVLGQFPSQSSTGGLIPLTWIRAAQDRHLEPGTPNELGLDVGASEHGDPSCLGWRRGPVFRVLYEERQPDTMMTLGKMLQHLDDKRYGAERVKVDYIGVGRGVVDRAREQKRPVFPISVGERATVMSCLRCKHEWDVMYEGRDDRCPRCGGDLVQPVYADLLSQLWWKVRERFEKSDIDLDPTDEALAEELMMLRWAPNSKGQTKVSYADGPSPNRADALLHTFAPVPPLAVKPRGLTW